MRVDPGNSSKSGSRLLLELRPNKILERFPTRRNRQVGKRSRFEKWLL
jgi:hypothetical protein